MSETNNCEVVSDADRHITVNEPGDYKGPILKPEHAGQIQEWDNIEHVWKDVRDRSEHE